MHVGMIIDGERLMHERTMLNRLTVGLIDEGLQITRIVPVEQELAHDSSEQRIALARRIETNLRVKPWLRRARTNRVLDDMQRSKPDMFYAIGRDAWPLGCDLMRVTEKPLALNVWSADLVHKAPQGRFGTRPAAYIAPTAPIVEALGKRFDPAVVSHVPMGVPVPENPHAVLDHIDDMVSLAIIGSGRDMPAYRAFISGLSRVTHEVPQVQAFLELRGPHGHDIWQHARRLDLLSHISTIRDAAQFRSLLTQCDMLIVPERYGEMCSITLEAMAYGMPVLASEDPALDFLVDKQTAVRVNAEDPDAWANALQRLINQPAEAGRLGERARAYVAEHHRSSIQVTRLAETFESCLHGQTYPFVNKEVTNGRPGSGT